MKSPKNVLVSICSNTSAIGTYVYEEYKELEIVAEVLRQKSTASAARYVHPTKELKKEAASIM